MAKLIILDSRGSQVVELAAVNTIGRSPCNTIHIDDLAMSRYHCQILRAGEGEFILRDSGSLNGTLLNGQRAAEVRLTEACEIMVGATRLRFLPGPSPIARQPFGLGDEPTKRRQIMLPDSGRRDLPRSPPPVPERSSPPPSNGPGLRRVSTGGAEPETDRDIQVPGGSGSGANGQRLEARFLRLVEQFNDLASWIERATGGADRREPRSRAPRPVSREARMPSGKRGRAMQEFCAQTSQLIENLGGGLSDPADDTAAEEPGLPKSGTRP